MGAAIGSALTSIKEKVLGRRQRQDSSITSSLSNRPRSRGKLVTRSRVPNRSGQQQSVPNRSGQQQSVPNRLGQSRVSNRLGQSHVSSTLREPLLSQYQAIQPIQPRLNVNMHPNARLTFSSNVISNTQVEQFINTSTNIIQIHQRHATTCANVLNKGFITSKFDIKTKLDLKELAPNTSLTQIGIEQCMQVSDFLLYCKSQNINYITDQKFTEINQFYNKPISNVVSFPLPPRPILIFCCSELLRTQQTLFITYFDIIKDYLKNGRKIIVLFWLNEKNFSKRVNADNFVVSLADTKQQWRYFINRIKNLNNDETFINNIGRTDADIKSLSVKLNLEDTNITSSIANPQKIDYSNWEDIFYLSPHIYNGIEDSDNNRAPTIQENFSFDNRKFSKKAKFSIIGETLYSPEELYAQLPRILSIYFSHSNIFIRGNNNINPNYFGIDFYEDSIRENINMNIVFVSHHTSGENTLKYLTGGQSENVFNQQQLMNCELIILPKGGIRGKGQLTDQQYEFTKKNRIFPVGFYNSMTTKKTIQKLNKKNKPININPLFILYHSKLDIFFTPLDIVKQEVEIISRPSPQSTQNSLGQGQAPVAASAVSAQEQPQIKTSPVSSLTTAVPEQSQQFGVVNFSFPLKKYLGMSLDDYIIFLNTSRDILTIFKNYYNNEGNLQPVYYQQTAVVNDSQSQGAAEVEHQRQHNAYFYNYTNLIKLITNHLSKIIYYNDTKKHEYNGPRQILNTEMGLSKNEQLKNTSKLLTATLLNSQKPEPATLLQYLRSKYDTQTLVRNFNNCLFDFCAITDPARNRFRKIVQTKLDLQIEEKNYDKIFNIELSRQLQKFIDNYEKEHGKIPLPPPNPNPNGEIPLPPPNPNPNGEIPPPLELYNKNLIPTFYEKYYSKRQLGNDIQYLKDNQNITNEIIDIYIRYGIIKLFNEAELKSLISSRNQNGITEISKKEINNKILKILQPFQKKFLEPYMHKNTRTNEELKSNSSTKINREVSKQSFGSLNPFVPMTVRGKRNVLDEIIAFYKTGHGDYKIAIINQINQDYLRCKDVFIIICKNYLKMIDDAKIRSFYNSYWKIITETYGNLNITYSQRGKLMIYISLLYKYDNKLVFFKNIYLFYTISTEKLYSNFFLEKKYIKIKNLGNNFTVDPMLNMEIIHYKLYQILGLGKLNPASNIFDNLFTLLQTQIIDIKIFNTLLYYVFNYNDNDIKKYYETYGLIFLYFILNLPNYILFDDYITNENLMNNYPDEVGDINNKNLTYIIELAKNEELYKKKSNNVIKKYVDDYIKYVKSLVGKINSSVGFPTLSIGNIRNNANKNKKITFVNDGQNSSFKAKYTNNSESLERRQPPDFPERKEVDIYTNLLMQGVYFAT